jgi:hypothetical protein
MNSRRRVNSTVMPLFMKKTIVHLLLVFGLLFAVAVNIDAQTAPTSEEISDAQKLFTGLLKDEARARRHVSFLVDYVHKSPWNFSTLVTLTQRLSVAGAEVAAIDDTLTPCGDMAVAIGGDDRQERFTAIVNIIMHLERGPESVAFYLNTLEDAGVPVFDFLGEAFGYSPDKVRDLAAANRIRREGAKRLLLESFTRHYGGLAAKMKDKH